METLITASLPFPGSSLTQIQEMLLKSNPIVHSDPTFSKYEMCAYIKEKVLTECEFHALFDLNVLSHTLALVRKADPSKSLRDTAALMAFLITMDCQIEFGISLIEYSTKNSMSKTITNLKAFRAADKVDPAIYASIAIGEKDRLLDGDIPKLEFEKDDNYSPYIAENYKQHYAALLKVSILSRSSGTGLDKYLRFFEWMADEFLFSACASVFAAIYFSPQPHKDMLKTKKTNSCATHLEGIRNAAWDLSIAHFWSYKSIDDYAEKKRWLLCSFDKTLHEIASFLVIVVGRSKEEQMIKLLSKHWPARQVGVIMDAMHAITERSIAEDRESRKIQVGENLGIIISDLEYELSMSIGM